MLPVTHSHTGGEQQSKLKKYKWWIVGGVAVLVVVVVLAVTLSKHGGNNDGPTPPSPPTPPPTPPLPANYNPYVVEQDRESNDESILSGFLQLSQSAAAPGGAELLSAYLASKAATHPRDIPTGANNGVFTNVSYEFGQNDYKVSYLILSDASSSRYSIPEEMASKPRSTSQMRLEMAGFQLLTKPFGFKFTSDRDPQNVLVSTEGGSFLMMDKYMQIDLQLPTRRIYGLGERVREFTLTEGAWTMWANGQNPEYDQGVGAGNSYGVHPFALVQSKAMGEFFGIYFRSSSAMSTVVTYRDEDAATLSYVGTGGQLEIYFMVKGTPKEIIQQYHAIIGKPTLPPLSALGWHAGGSAYKSQADYKANIDGYRAADIPLENVWVDAVQTGRNFLVDSTKFPNMTQFKEDAETNGQKVLLGLGPGLSSASAEDDYYSAALQQNLLLRSSQFPEDRRGVLTQNVSGDLTVFLDFMDGNSTQIWQDGLKALQSQFGSGSYDGIWLDMNEATGACDGECPSGLPAPAQRPDVQNHTWYTSYSAEDSNSTYMLPFIPGPYWNLDNMTLSLNGTHPNLGFRQLDTHSLFGHAQGKLTKEQLEALDQHDQRQQVYSRSTFAGSGRFVQHWQSHNQRTWDSMRLSISHIMNFNMFGIPMTGPDTCGFYGASDQDELCGRWLQLA